MTITSMDLGKTVKVFGLDDSELLATVSEYDDNYKSITLGYVGSDSGLSFDVERFNSFCDFMLELKKHL